jgi:hypothetical protein
MSSAFDRVFTRGLQSSTPRKTESSALLRSIRASPWAARLSGFELGLQSSLIAALAVVRS